jgi:murein DD-endopeptidase MepM/ murein hydrolase activator NlpD
MSHYFLVLLIVSASFGSLGCYFQPKITELDSQELNEINEEFPIDGFGYSSDIGILERGQVQANESLYVLLNEMGISQQVIRQVSNELKQSVGFRFLKENQIYYRYRLHNSTPEAYYAPILIIMESNIRYVKVDVTDGILVQASAKPIEIRFRQVEGLIESSLYESLISQGHSAGVGMELSELFAWQIDFFRLYRGDKYRAIYEEFISEGEVVGVGRVLAAEFVHQNRPYQAFYYEDSQQQGYYDAEGNGIQKALLKAPFKYNQRISSSFNYNRFHPVLKQRIPHTGTDYAAPLGTPVIAVGDGEIIESRYRGVNGNIVQIQHNGMYKTAYLHLNGFGPGIKKGVQVKQGQVIGYVGRTGRVTGVHLHYTLYKNNVPVNSVTVELPSQESLAASAREAFLLEVQKYSYLLGQGGLVLATNIDLNDVGKNS